MKFYLIIMAVSCWSFFVIILVGHLVFALATDEDTVDKVVRVQYEEKGIKIVTMSDGEMLVNLQLGSSGNILDCKVVRRRRMALGMIQYDVSSSFFSSFKSIQLIFVRLI